MTWDMIKLLMFIIDNVLFGFVEYPVPGKFYAHNTYLLLRTEY